jgi:hypothetical protein
MSARSVSPESDSTLGKALTRDSATPCDRLSLVYTALSSPRPNVSSPGRVNTSSSCYLHELTDLREADSGRTTLAKPLRL